MTSERLLIDDFESADGVSCLGTAWQGFTDRVMGGRSDLQVVYRPDDQGILSLRGEVRLENKGGFIQVRLPLTENGSVDASPWDAIRLRVRAAPGPYFIHLRTRDTRQPWAYYRASIPVSERWQTVDIPFAQFQPKNLRARLDLTHLRSLGLVAYGERFNAQLDVAQLEFVETE